MKFPQAMLSGHSPTPGNGLPALPEDEFLDAPLFFAIFRHIIEMRMPVSDMAVDKIADAGVLAVGNHCFHHLMKM